MTPHRFSISPSRIIAFERVLALLLVLAITILIVVRAVYAGALWRDQCGTTQLALMPLGELLRNFDHQTLPPLLPLVYRIYLKAFGTSNSIIQTFRLLTAVGILAVALVSMRVNAKQPPLLLLSLLGLDSVFLYWGGYVITTISIAAVVPLAAALLLQSNHTRSVALAVAALISVQLLINNLLLVAVIAVCAIAACLASRSYKLSLVFIGVLILCVLSDAVYLYIYAAADWRILLKRPVTFAWLWPQIRPVFGQPAALMLSAWYFVFGATLIAAGWRFVASRRSGDTQRRRLAMFAVLLGLLTPTTYCISFVLSGIESAEARHFLPMLGVVVANFDIIIAHLANYSWIRIARILLAMTVLCVTPLVAWQEVTERQTNIDIVAKTLEQNVASDDLIIVNPWPFGISFNWYYHGAARWLTVPNISDHRIHRYDLVKEKMVSSAPLEDIKGEIGKTLRGGHRVWVVGALFPLETSGWPLFPMPAPDPQFGWQHMVYREAWARQLRDFIAARARQAKRVIQPMEKVNPLEDVSLWVVEGEND